MTGIKVSWNYSENVDPIAKYGNEDFIKIVNIMHALNSTEEIWNAGRRLKTDFYINETFAKILNEDHGNKLEDMRNNINLFKTVEQQMKLKNVSSIPLKETPTKEILKSAFDLFVFLSSYQNSSWISWLKSFKNNLDEDNFDIILMKISQIKSNENVKQLLEEIMSENNELNLNFVPLERMTKMDLWDNAKFDFLGLL